MSFNLLPEDEEYLNANFPSLWEYVTEGGKNGIIIREYPVPEDMYTASKSDLMIIIPTEYPTAALDMFYFCPPLTRNSGAGINAISIENHFGFTWQRWSRHYQWVPGECSIVTHISWVANQLRYNA